MASGDVQRFHAPSVEQAADPQAFAAPGARSASVGGRRAGMTRRQLVLNSAIAAVLFLGVVTPVECTTYGGLRWGEMFAVNSIIIAFGVVMQLMMGAWNRRT